MKGDPGIIGPPGLQGPTGPLNRGLVYTRWGDGKGLGMAAYPLLRGQINEEMVRCMHIVQCVPCIYV